MKLYISEYDGYAFRGFVLTAANTRAEAVEVQNKHFRNYHVDPEWLTPILVRGTVVKRTHPGVIKDGLIATS
jgi:hypothetical protein